MRKRKEYPGIVALALTVGVILSACSAKTGDLQDQTLTEPEPIIIENHEEETAIEETTGTEDTDSETPDTTATDSSGIDHSASNQSKPSAAPNAGKTYKVTAYDATMYVTQPVHVRASYTTQSEVLTSLAAGQKVKVTGQAENGWIRISYGGKDAYIYKAYLSKAPSGQANTAGQTAKAKPTEGAGATPDHEAAGLDGQKTESAPAAGDSQPSGAEPSSGAILGPDINSGNGPERSDSLQAEIPLVPPAPSD